MPDYSKTIIYRICCKDPSIKDTYIGSTTNLTKRKYRHKQRAILFPTRRVYECILKNGGWVNWEFDILENQPVENKIEMLKRERFYLEYHQATLNCMMPYRTKEELKEVHTCDCLGRFQIPHITDHKKTTKHKDFEEKSSTI